MPTTAPQPLDADIAGLEQRWKESGIPGLYEGRDGPVSRERARNIRAFLYPKPTLPTGKIVRSIIPGPDGPVPVEIVHPVEGSPRGTLVYFHGGGFVVGDLDSHQAHAIRFANRARVVVMHVDYRLAPEHPFPAGVSDAIAATKWAAANLGELGGTGNPLAVGGDSSGGNFAAVASIKCRDAGIKLAGQVLLYGGFGAARRGINEAQNGGGVDVPIMYFGEDRIATATRTIEASPILADHKGVAPALIGVGRYDFLYQDSLAYAAKLKADGVRVIYREFPTLNHGFFSYTAISTACAAAADLICDDFASMISGPCGTE
jgi:acetyl esterase